MMLLKNVSLYLMVHVFVHLVFISRVHSDFQNLQSCSVPHAGGLQGMNETQ